MTNPRGIEETKDALVAAVRVIQVVREVGSDGFQIQDVGVLITDESLRDAILEAFNGATKIPSELGDLSMIEGFSLAQELIGALRQLAAYERPSR